MNHYVIGLICIIIVAIINPLWAVILVGVYIGCWVLGGLIILIFFIIINPWFWFLIISGIIYVLFF